MLRKAVMVTCVISIFILAFILILLIVPIPTKLLKDAYSFFFDHSPWIDIWLSIFSIAISLITATVANNISMFSFYKEIDISVDFTQPVRIEDVTENAVFNYYKRICKNKKKRKLLNTANPELYKLEICLNEPLNLSLNHEVFDMYLGREIESFKKFAKKDVLFLETFKGKNAEENIHNKNKDKLLLYINLSNQDMYHHLKTHSIYVQDSYLYLIVRFKVKSKNNSYSEKIQLNLILQHTDQGYKPIGSFTFTGWRSHIKSFSDGSIF